MKHTAGPWIAHSSGDGFIFIERDFGNSKAHPEWMVASIQSYQKEDVANARLIAAAPELLEALNRTVYLIKEGGFTHPMTEEFFDSVFNQGRAAIAKATGKD